MATALRDSKLSRLAQKIASVTTDVPEDGLILVPEMVMPCPDCATMCQVGVRSGGRLLINCPQDGAISIARDPEANLRPVERMDPEERLWVITVAVRNLLNGPQEGDFLVIQSLSLPCNYVQLRYNQGQLWAEVCSREWNCPYCGNRPLGAAAKALLAERGFSGGGVRRNYESYDVTGTAIQLAHALEQLLSTVFGEPEDFAIAVYPKRRETLRSILAQFAADRGGGPAS